MSESKVENKKAQKAQKAVAALVGLILLAAVASYFLFTRVFGLNDVASVFLAIGVFFIILWVQSLISCYTDSKLPKIRAKVLSCEYVKEKDEEGVVEAEYYVTKYSFLYNGAEKVVEEIGENGYEVGDEEDVIYNKRNDSVINYKRHKEISSFKNNRNMLILILVFLAIGGIGQVCSVVFAEGGEELVVKYYALFIGVLFVVIGFFILKGTIKRRHDLHKYMQAEGTLIEFREENGSEGDKVYYPVYEYWYNGEMRTHRCSYGSNGKDKLGSKTTIYISEEEGIFDQKEIGGNSILFGLVFLGFGVIALVAFIFG